MTLPSPLLDVKNLSVTRGGVEVLDIPSLAIHGGEVLTLIGPNGAGKSSLLLALACLIRAEHGSIIFKGRHVNADNGMLNYRRNITMVFQEPLLFDTTVFRNVAAGLKIRKVPGREIKGAAMAALARFGIGHLAGRDAKKLSGGEAQRASLARAFALKPEIVFLDEPFSSLDPPTREALIDDLHAILKETKTTTIMATHDIMEALRLSDRIAVMKDGRILQIDSPDEVVNHPVDEFVASFVGMETILDGNVTGSEKGIMAVTVGTRVICAVGSLGGGEKVRCGIRPEQVILSASSPEGDTSARNTFESRITKIVPLGLFYKVYLDCGFPMTAYVTQPSLENLSLREGAAVFASFKATAVHVIRR
ncbi:MAG: ABC transporter ATP-binding protein [Deltaproteobacteria bacterium]|nr:ABC transporter ATP-binding protein [Deltaproteobacteria bacterium]